MKKGNKKARAPEINGCARVSWACSQDSLRNAVLSLMRRNVIEELARRSPEYALFFSGRASALLLGGAVGVRDDDFELWLSSFAHDIAPASWSVAEMMASTVWFGLSFEPGHWIVRPHARPTSAAFRLRATTVRSQLQRCCSALCRRLAASAIMSSRLGISHLFC